MKHSGFVTVVGRPNVGKSSMVNAICGSKISIVSDKPQTTRGAIRGIYHRDETQLVFVDTPGIHKPITALGERLNETAAMAMRDDVDVVCFVIDATKRFGTGDKWVAARLPKNAVVIVNKIDRVNPDQLVAQLVAASQVPADAYFPVSSVTGEGLPALIEYLIGRMPEGPAYFPVDQLSDQAESTKVAELVREQLLARTDDELPYSIATRVTEWRWPHITCEILVERESQKGMVIGKGGAMLKAVGIAVREQLPEGVYLELRVRVDQKWQHRRDRVDRLLDMDPEE